MKNLQSYDEFLNEKAYLLTGEFGAKGIPGKVLFAFKKQIERIRFEKTGQNLLDEINKTWSKWAPKEGAKVIEAEVMKQVKDTEAVRFITATLNVLWKFDTINRINSSDIEKDKKAYITLDTTDFVINIGFSDDVPARKFANRLGGIGNDPIYNPKEFIDIVGEFSDEVGQNNVEIRSSMFILIDEK